MVNGGACQGKTETACEALACYEDEWLALYDQNPSAVAGTLDLHVPAVYVRTPVKATPISACQRILRLLRRALQGHAAGGPASARSRTRSSTTGPRRS